MPTAAVEKVVPPYGSFKTVKTFVGQLAKTVFPDALDRHMMKGMSGATQSEVLSALRFLGCIDDRDKTTPALKSLTSMHGKEGWATALKVVIEKAYKPITDAVSVKSGSGKQLNDAFKKVTGADGFMLARHVRFYLTALKDAGIAHSPHFKVPAAAAAKKKTVAKKSEKPKSAKMGAPGSEENGDNGDPPPPGTQKYPLYFKDKPAGVLIVPQNLSLSDCRVIELQLEVLKAYTNEETQK